MAKFTGPSAQSSDDPYGHCGAFADRCWTEVWTTWSRETIDDHIRSAATWGLLDKVQAGQLIQGLPPQPKGWPEAGCCIAEAAAAVERFHLDIARGAIPSAIAPEELAAWCDLMAVALPQPFVDGLQKARINEARPFRAVQAVVPLHLAKWIPKNLVDSCKATKAVGTRGRPATKRATYEALVKAGSELLMSKAREGERMTLGAVARELLGKPVAAGMTLENIHRRIKGKLPVDSATATAQAVIASR